MTAAMMAMMSGVESGVPDEFETTGAVDVAWAM
jgi:hypothetical protein